MKKFFVSKKDCAKCAEKTFDFLFQICYNSKAVIFTAYCLAPSGARAKNKGADMAQLVEQRIRNAQVIGSNPIISSRKTSIRNDWCFLFYITVFNADNLKTSP